MTTIFLFHLVFATMNTIFTIIIPSKFYIWLYGICLLLQTTLYIITLNNFYVVLFAALPFITSIITYKFNYKK